jgi:8-oxo-dGTP pyrophosphatase MutT (NUDIX family)
MPASQPATPVLAVSVIPVRQSQGPGLDVFVQHRAKTMDFAASVVVFPGGRVNTEDHAEPQGKPVSELVLDQQVTAWARTSIAEAGPERTRALSRALLGCGRREVQEETGLNLEPEDLIPWANWITPPDLPKRFDTYFFVAQIRKGQQLTHQTTEADSSEWRTVASLLSAYEDNRIRLMRPTLALLTDLAHIALPSDMTGPREIIPQRPRRARAY